MNNKFYLLGFWILVGVVLGGILWSTPVMDFARAAIGGVINISGIIRGVTSPINDNDVATKGFVNTAGGTQYIVWTVSFDVLNGCSAFTGWCPTGWTIVDYNTANQQMAPSNSTYHCWERTLCSKP